MCGGHSYSTTNWISVRIASSLLGELANVYFFRELRISASCLMIGTYINGENVSSKSIFCVVYLHSCFSRTVGLVYVELD